MGAESWKEEFYPVEAAALVDSRADDITLVKHSLQKWKGLRKENLEKHHLIFPPIQINTDTCSLCQEYYPDLDKDYDTGTLDCEGCPLFEYLGQQRCDDDSQGRSVFGGYNRYFEGSEEPMIEALEETLKQLEKEDETTKGCQ